MATRVDSAIFAGLVAVGILVGVCIYPTGKMPPAPVPVDFSPKPAKTPAPVAHTPAPAPTPTNWGPVCNAEIGGCITPSVPAAGDGGLR